MLKTLIRRTRPSYRISRIQTRSMQGKYDTNQSVVYEPLNGAKATSCVVFCHGLGDTARGWSDTIQDLQQSLPEARLILPTAPVSPVTLNGGMRMTSWHDITSLDVLDRDEYPGIDESRAIVHTIVNDQIASGIPSERILLGGFSQGAGLSVYSGYSFPQRLAGVVALSGYCPLYQTFGERLTDANAKTPAFVAHGSADMVVPYKAGERLRDTLEKHGMDVTFLRVPNMGHSAAPMEIAHMFKFIVSRLTAELGDGADADTKE